LFDTLDPEATVLPYVERILKSNEAEGDALLYVARQLGRSEHDPDTIKGKVVGLASALAVAAASTTPALLALVALEELQQRGRLGGCQGHEPRIEQHTPLTGLYRITKEKTEIAGVMIEEGANIFLAWAESAAAEIGEVPNPLVFGHGVHRCPAAHGVSLLAADLRLSLLRRPNLVLGSAWKPEFHGLGHFRPLRDLIVSDVGNSSG
jgi:hypothetical protein